MFQAHLWICSDFNARTTGRTAAKSFRYVRKSKKFCVQSLQHNDINKTKGGEKKHCILLKLIFIAFYDSYIMEFFFCLFSQPLCSSETTFGQCTKRINRKKKLYELKDYKFNRKILDMWNQARTLRIYSMFCFFCKTNRILLSASYTFSYECFRRSDGSNPKPWSGNSIQVCILTLFMMAQIRRYEMLRKFWLRFWHHLLISKFWNVQALGFGVNLLQMRRLW